MTVYNSANDVYDSNISLPYTQSACILIVISPTGFGCSKAMSSKAHGC